MKATYHALTSHECKILADSLGDGPETVIPAHLLCRGLARAYVEGTPNQFSGAIVQSVLDPGEPIAVGNDPELIWRILQSVPGWHCISVVPECASDLSEMMKHKTGLKVRHYGEVHLILHQPAQAFHHNAVRQLTKDDLPLLEHSHEELSTHGYENVNVALTEGIIVGGIVDNQLVAIAETPARTPRHADVGIHTLEAWRNQGMATAAASLAAQLVQASGQIPVWSTGEDNDASRRVAEKIGFIETQRRTYLIPQKP